MMMRRACAFGTRVSLAQPALVRRLATEPRSRFSAWWESSFLGGISVGDFTVVTTSALVGVGIWYVLSTSTGRSVNELKKAVTGKLERGKVLSVLAVNKVPDTVAFEVLCLLLEQPDGVNRREITLLLQRLQKAASSLADSNPSALDSRLGRMQLDAVRAAVAVLIIDDAVASLNAQPDQASSAAGEAGQLLASMHRVAATLWDVRSTVQEAIVEAETSGAAPDSEQLLALLLLERFVVAHWACLRVKIAHLEARKQRSPSGVGTGAAEAARSLKAVRKAREAARGGGSSVPALASGAPVTQFALGLTEVLGRPQCFDVLLPRTPKGDQLPLWAQSDEAEALLEAAVA